MYRLPNRPERITFNWLFNRVAQEEVYTFYLGFCELNKKFKNPLRKDSQADCSFYWHNSVLFFNDFAIRKTYTAATVVMEVKKIGFIQALNLIYDVFIGDSQDDFSITPKPIIKRIKEYKDIQVKIQPFQKQDIEYLKSFGITSKLCKLYKVYGVMHYWINGDMKYSYNQYNPCIGYYFNGRWKLYHYKATEYRFVGNTSHSDLQGYDQMEWIGDLCIITKSLKDVMVYRSFEIEACAPHSESLSAWKEHIPRIKERFKRVVLNFDNDKAGKNASDEIIKEFPMETFFVPEEKDISDYRRAFGQIKTQELIDALWKKR
jgi:hypothetical protein